MDTRSNTWTGRENTTIFICLNCKYISEPMSLGTCAARHCGCGREKIKQIDYEKDVEEEQVDNILKELRKLTNPERTCC